MKRIILANIIGLILITLILFPILNKRGVSDQVIGTVIGQIFFFIILGEAIIIYGSKMIKKIKKNTDEKMNQVYKK